MFNLLSRATPKQAARLVRYSARLAKALGATVRQDKDSCRYFVQNGNDHYILAARSTRKRDVETVEGDTYRAHHAGYLSLYKEMDNASRYVWDVQQRDLG